ncbi:MAG: metallophosphoesterase [Candidatus Moranbacteria bacterium]|nr:metallophosphoesterase [Candidatus Moranbacteria bacterium]
MKSRKIFLIIFLGILFIGALAFGAYAHLKAMHFLPEKEEVEVEIIDGSGENASFVGAIKNKATEESLEEDAEQLTVSEDDDAAEEETDDAAEENDSSYSILPPPANKEKNANELKIGFVTDLHVRSHSLENGTRVLKQFFTNGINYFIEKMNSDFSPNFILANGDMIEGTGRSSEIGKEELSLVKKLFDRISIKKYWVVGNHDLRSVDKKQWQKSLETDYLHKSFDAGDYRIIILDSNFNSKDEDVDPETYNTRGRISDKEMDWLQKELESAEKPVIIFMHHPPLWDTEVAPNGRFPGNARSLQEIFSKNHVLAVFAGHLEDLYVDEIDGVKYYILPGFVKNKKYQKTFSAITVKDREIAVDMSYLTNGEKYRTIRITK